MVERARQHLTTRESEGVVDKSALMEFAAAERGLAVERLTSRLILVKADGRELGFAAMNGPSCTPFGRAACNDKETARRFIKSNGLPVAESRTFRSKEIEAAWEYVSALDGPAVVKPLSSSRSRGLTTGVATREELTDAIAAARRTHRSSNKNPTIMVERQVRGLDYRLFVAGGSVAYATLRRRARVRGDGSHSIGELIQRKNRRRKKNPYLGQLLISTDMDQLDLLRPQGLSLNDVPGDGEHVTLCSVPNLYRGGDSVDVTDRIHRSYKDLAVRAVESIPGMQYAGVDLIAEDISTEATASNVIVSEVEYSPAPLSYFPWYGEPRDMGGPILDSYLGANQSSILSRLRNLRKGD